MNTTEIEVLSIVGCVIVSAFFSAAETAITSLSAFRVRQLVDLHPRTGRALRLWETNHAGILTTILIGNNGVNITASALATDLATLYFPRSGVPIAIGAMTFILLITGEIAPKTLARAYAEQVAIPMMNVVAVFHVLIFPVTWFITRIIRLLITMMGGRIKQSDTVTEEDIEYIITLSHRQGGLDSDKQHLLSSIFEFSDTTTREIMVPRTQVVGIALDMPFQEVLKICVDSGFSRIPVYRDSIDQVIGIFHTKYLITPPKAEDWDAFLRSRMRPPVFVPESKKIDEMLKLFQQDRVHIAIVVNEFGGTEGIVTLEDVIEQLLGDIQDEFDQDEQFLKSLPEGGFAADARVDIELVEEALHIHFPENRTYESLGGFLMEAAEEVPEAGWSHEYLGYVFTVTQAALNRVNKVRISRVQPQAEEPAAAGPAAPEAPEPAAPER